MGNKLDKILYKDPFLDSRTKLIPCQKEMIVYYRKQGWSQKKLAAHFNVSRRMIQFVIDPEKLKKNKENYKNRGGSKKYYKKEKHTMYIQKHRARKKVVLKDQQIVKFRRHAASIEESMKTIKLFDNYLALYEYLLNYYAELGADLIDLKFIYCGYDARIDWQSYYVMVRMAQESEFNLAGYSDGVLN